jgi:hypothetical protein
MRGDTTHETLGEGMFIHFTYSYRSDSIGSSREALRAG